MTKRQGKMLFVAMVGIMCVAGATQAATLDSADFAYKYEADALPSATDWTEIGTAGSGFSVANGELSYSTSTLAGGRWIAANTTIFNPTTSTDYTAEARFKVTAASGEVPGVNFVVGNGSEYAFLTISTDSIRYMVGGNHNVIASGLDNTAMHAYRIAFSAATDSFSLWRDGSLISDSLAAFSSSNKTVSFGDASSTTAGAASLDYLRIDTTGAYAPVPEPATLSLLAVAGLAALRRRRK